MIFKLLRLLCVLLTIIVVFHKSSSDGDDSSLDESSAKFLNLIGNDFNGAVTRPAARTLLSTSNEHDTALVADVDGKVHLVERKSGEVLWSFSSGSSIYSSYQAPAEHNNDNENYSHIGRFYIDCGDDWALYLHDAFGKKRLSDSIEDFISNTPLIAEDVGFVFGSKKTTVFRVDAMTGRLIYTYRLSELPPKSQSDDENNILDLDELPLYITRSDYLLKSFVINSDKVLWNLTVSEIGVALLCQGSENPNSEVLLDADYHTGLPFNMPLPCQSKAVVYRFRNPIMIGDSKNGKMLAGPKRKYLMLP